MKYTKYCEQLREALKDINDEAQYVGEDGGMVTNCKTKREALKRFKKLEIDCNGSLDFEISIKDIIPAFLHLAEETTKEQRQCMEIDEDSWYIDINSPSPVTVWYYTA